MEPTHEEQGCPQDALHCLLNSDYIRPMILMTMLHGYKCHFHHRSLSFLGLGASSTSPSLYLLLFLPTLYRIQWSGQRVLLAALKWLKGPWFPLLLSLLDGTHRHEEATKCREASTRELKCTGYQLSEVKNVNEQIFKNPFELYFITCGESVLFTSLRKICVVVVVW